MKIHRALTGVALGLGLMGCNDAAGLGLIQLRGIWIADSIVYTDNADANNTVDTVVRDGASWQMTVLAGGSVSAFVDDGVNTPQTLTGQAPRGSGTFTIGDVEYGSTRVLNDITLTNTAQMFEFDSVTGLVSATVQIFARRLG